MNAAFLELPEEKRGRIVNSGYEVFARYEYKRASTEEIALKAGISKGLLFYYFHDKKTFYGYLFECAAERIKANVVDEGFDSVTDFFDLCAYASERKYRLLAESPYIMDFIVRAYYAMLETGSEAVKEKVARETKNLYFNYFAHVDTSKFREEMNPEEVFRMLTWMTDGFLHERQRMGQSVDLGEVMEQFRRWSAYFRRMAYKPEFQQTGD